MCITQIYEKIIEDGSTVHLGAMMNGVKTIYGMQLTEDFRSISLQGWFDKCSPGSLVLVYNVEYQIECQCCSCIHVTFGLKLSNV